MKNRKNKNREVFFKKHKENLLIEGSQNFNVHSRRFFKTIFNKSVNKVKLKMLFNNRTANNNPPQGKGHQRGKSLGFSSFSFTGVRYFEPKFMSGLNKGTGDQGLKSVEKEKTSTKSINA